MSPVLLVLVVSVWAVHALELSRETVLEMALLPQLSGAEKVCYFKNEDWIDHQYVQGSVEARRAFIQSGLHTVCCTGSNYGVLLCAVVGKETQGDMFKAVRLLYALVGSYPLSVDLDSGISTSLRYYLE